MNDSTMIYRILILILLTSKLSAQDIDSLIVLETERFSNMIDTNTTYLRLHEDGVLEKKSKLGIKKEIGSFYSNVVYYDTLIYQVETEYYYFKNSKIVNETFYNNNNELVKYSREKRSDNKLKHSVNAYFLDYELKSVIDTIYDDYAFDLKQEEYVLKKAADEIELRIMTTQEWDKLFNKEDKAQ